MDSWYQASPLSALEVEARRVAAEEGRFPPNAPGMTHYSSGVVEYNDLPRTHSRSRSDSSCGTPPAYPDNRLNCTRAGQGHLPATSNHGNTSCSDQFLPVTNYVEECISYHQPPWKSDHKIGTSHPDLSAAFTTPNQHSNLYDLLWRRRPSHALQSRSVANPGFQAGYSPSSSPSSAQKQAQFYPTETRPYHYPGRYTFINQVFKPLYKTDREKETGNNHALTSGSPQQPSKSRSVQTRSVSLVLNAGACLHAPSTWKHTGKLTLVTAHTIVPSVKKASPGAMICTVISLPFTMNVVNYARRVLLCNPPIRISETPQRIFSPATFFVGATVIKRSLTTDWA
ncbi:hypothetical protein PCANC_13505 [Puccinia coronata f. sp. avenae]|uniref:Uncharacterized protein n=1 Tax=Puccinia coronata f. sp. avenae TaxID=200324 RepID=A0A2N5ULZ8_9BASI|nr:hypothetical protein PCASD_21601 [Puccinia coronata f. sp. avenae]PLW27176.1 hypothetical protein PCANC_26395 [Puccinia coronata f. sp. avenae]PLW38793.1 hypothetical protein PCASD_12598 [Puccinia coronata f. sp. avenae]PLW44957.1 hypothetical protein PCANC_13505 [Puccinia coronata f. sp. avenae]